MQDGTVWELPFTYPPTLELRTDWGSIALLPVEPGGKPRLELSRGSAEDVRIDVESIGQVVRVALEPRRGWFGLRECRATLFVPQDVRASIETNAGSVRVRDLRGCELGIKTEAGSIELADVSGLMHLAATAGTIKGQGLGGLFEVSTHAGSVRLEIVDLQPGEHRIRASIGSIRLELARGMDVAIEAHTSMGSVRNRYAGRQAAPARLVLSSDMGSIQVDEAPTMTAPRPRQTPEPMAQDCAETSEPSDRDAELERILKMVEAGDLSARDADELIRAMGHV